MFRWCGVFYLLNVAANPYALVRCELISTILLSESKYFIIFTFLGHLLVIPYKTAKAFIFFLTLLFSLNLTVTNRFVSPRPMQWLY